MTTDPDHVPVRAHRASWDRIIVNLAAWFEILVGVSFLLVLNAQSKSLFGVVPEGIGIVFGHFSGIALIGLGTACLSSKFSGPQQAAVSGLFLLNLGAAVCFAWVAIATGFRGFMLWPVVTVHSAIAIVLVPQLLKRKTNAYQSL